MTRQCVDICFGSHIPNTGGGISTASHQNVDCWMKRHAVDGAQVAVVVSNDFVVFEIPAFHLSIFTGTEQVGVSRADLKGTNCTDVTGE